MSSYVSSLEPFVVPNVELTGVELGRGAYGVVQEAKIPGAVCATKKLHNDLIQGDLNYLERKFLNECVLMSSLRHPHIIQFLGICYLTGSRLPAIVMERLETSLQELLEKSLIDIPLTTKRSILLDVARGLFYLHSHTPPIIHRDLTAKNVLLNSSMVAKISDLGVAKMIEVQPGELVTAATMSTGPGNIMYMPPEAMEGHARYSTSIDIFSFGHIILFTLTQVFPSVKAATYIHSTTHTVVGRSEIERREESVQQICSELGYSNTFVSLVRQCLQNLPTNRPRAPDLIERLENAKVESGSMYESLNKLELLQRITEMEKDTEMLLEQIQIEQDKNERLQKDVVSSSQQQENQIIQKEQHNDCTVNSGGLATQSDSDKLIFPKTIPLQIEWKRTGSLPVPTSFKSSLAVVLKGKCYLYDGRQVLVFTPENESGHWTRLQMPGAQRKSTLATVNGQLVAVGGVRLVKSGKDTKTVDSNDIAVWEESSSSWTYPYPPMPHECHDSAAVGFKHYLVVIGGRRVVVSSLSEVMILDTNTKQWYSTETGMPYCNWHGKPVIIGDTLYLILHFVEEVSMSKKVIKVSLHDLISQVINGCKDVKSLWKELRNIPFYGSTPCAVGNMLAIVGGRPGGFARRLFLERTKLVPSEPSSDIYAYHPEMNDWIKVGEIPIGRWFCGCAMLPSGEFLVAGGEVSMTKSDLTSSHICSIQVS